MVRRRHGKMDEYTYAEAIRQVIDVMEEIDHPAAAVVSTDGYDENLYDHYNDIEDEGEDPTRYALEFDNCGIAYITRLDKQAYRTDDVTKVYPGEIYLRERT
jgi:hypothetical protein